MKINLPLVHESKIYSPENLKLLTNFSSIKFYVNNANSMLCTNQNLCYSATVFPKILFFCK